MSEAGKKEECSTNNETPTPYMEMCTQANKVPSIYNILAALFSWLTLAGFVVLPGTFTSLKYSTTLSSSKGGQIIQKTVQNVPLLLITGVMCGIRIIGTCWLRKKWRKEYVWLTGQIFL
jgi:hypothetical protein